MGRAVADSANVKTLNADNFKKYRAKLFYLADICYFCD